MPKLYDTENELSLMLRYRSSQRSLCYASELMERFKFSEEEMDNAVERAFKACYSLRIPIGENFRSVFRSGENSLSNDWKLSPLACYLVLINADPGNAEIAHLQLVFATKKFNDVDIF
jgi:hypothetical protein